MDRIYRQAQKVLFWLGPEDVLTKDGIYILDILARAWDALQARWSHGQPSNDMVGKIIGTIGNSPLLKSLGVPVIAWRQWQAVLALYRRSWFSRSWSSRSLLWHRICCLCVDPGYLKCMSWGGLPNFSSSHGRNIT
jgi:hypothetical protein